MNKPIIVVGGGGYAKVLVSVLLMQGQQVLGFTDIREHQEQETILGVPYLGNDEAVCGYDADEVLLVNGIGSVSVTTLRKRLFEHFSAQGYLFADVIHPSAIIAPDVSLAGGVQIMAGAVIQPGCHIGTNTIINTRASVDYDCQIGSHVHIAHGAILSGGITVEDDVHIGAGATVIQGMHIESNSVVAAGAVVVKSVKSGAKVFGVPAKEV
jgi:UDP-perosamine 4-acetyltransferase